MIGFNRRATQALVSGILMLAASQACSSSDDNPTPDAITGGAPSVGGSNAAGGKSSSGGKSSDQGSAGETVNGTAGEGSGGKSSSGGTQSGASGAPDGVAGAGDVDTGAGGEAGSGSVSPPGCGLPETGADGCFNCPSAPAEWLDRCVEGSDCVPFTKTLPLLDENGRVPALPN